MPVLCPGCLAWLSRGPGQCLWWGPVWLLDLTKGLAVAPGAAPTPHSLSLCWGRDCVGSYKKSSAKAWAEQGLWSLAL